MLSAGSRAVAALPPPGPRQRSYHSPPLLPSNPPAPSHRRNSHALFPRPADLSRRARIVAALVVAELPSIRHRRCYRLRASSFARRRRATRQLPRSGPCVIAHSQQFFTGYQPVVFHRRLHLLLRLAFPLAAKSRVFPSPAT